MTIRSERKRQAVLDAARDVFVKHGYRAVSMDQVAAAAGVSKVTIYNHFADKKTLFTHVIVEAIDTADSDQPLTADRIGDDLEAGMREIGSEIVRAVLDPRIVRMRRTIIGEADEFPDLAQTWYERSVQSTYDELAGLFGELTGQGRLEVPDPMVAAQQFLWLVLSVPMNRAMFHHVDKPLSGSEVNQYVDNGVRTFLTVYGVSPQAAALDR